MNCPDDGTCHHECGDGPCFRVQTCEPLSGVYPLDQWPAKVLEEHEVEVDPKLIAGVALMESVLELVNDVRSARSERDKAYRERDQLVAVLAKLFPAHLFRDPHSDDDDEYGWVVCVHMPAVVGQATWHIHESELPLFKHLYESPDHWDGHTTEEKYERLARMPIPAGSWVRKKCAHRLMVEGGKSVGCTLMEDHVVKLQLHKSEDGREWTTRSPGSLVPKGM